MSARPGPALPGSERVKGGRRGKVFGHTNRYRSSPEGGHERVRHTRKLSIYGPRRGPGFVKHRAGRLDTIIPGKARRASPQHVNRRSKLLDQAHSRARYFSILVRPPRCHPSPAHDLGTHVSKARISLLPRRIKWGMGSSSPVALPPRLAALSSLRATPSKNINTHARYRPHWLTPNSSALGALILPRG